MKPVLSLLLLTALGACGAVTAQPALTNADLEIVAEGWSLGSWSEIHSSRWDEEAGRWRDVIEQSPWKKWDIELLGPGLVELRMSAGPPTRIAFRDGTYREVGPEGTADEDLPPPNTIVESKVRSLRDWRLLIEWPPRPGEDAASRNWSELFMTGDVFTWSNWVGTSRSDRTHVSISINRIVP